MKITSRILFLRAAGTRRSRPGNGSGGRQALNGLFRGYRAITRPGAFGRFLLFAGLLLAAIGTAQAQIESAPRLNGTMIVTERAGVRIHSYAAPVNGWLVNTQIVEGPNKLIIFDAQFLTPFAEEISAYAKSLAKPVDRIVLSHEHPDHWAGLAVLTQHFPGVPVYALQATTNFIKAAGDQILSQLRKNIGEAVVASRLVVPDNILQPGKLVLDGIEFEFHEFRETESESQLVALLPQQRLLLAFDLVFNPNDHVFTVEPFFDRWVATLDTLKSIQSYDRIITGHGLPTDRGAIDSTIQYIQTAGQIYAASPDAKTYVEGVKAAFPNRQQPRWLEFSASRLYSKPKK